MNWHRKYKDNRTYGDKLADKVAAIMGSWKFIIAQTVVVVLWMILNIIGIVYEWDKYPFILLNLLFSTQAAYAAPIIMMSQNRQSEKDRLRAESDYKTNKRAKLEIEQLIKSLDRIELEKLDKILELVSLHRLVEGIYETLDGKFILRVNSKTISQHDTVEEAKEAHNNYYRNQENDEGI